MKFLLRKILCFISATLIVFSSLFLFACQKIYDSVEFSYFNTIVRVQVEDKKLTDEIKTELSSLFSNYENQFDRKNTNSFTYRFNNAELGKTFTLTDEQALLLNRSIIAKEYSNGLFDISIYPLLELWQFAPNYPVKNFIVPTASQVQNALEKQQDISDLEFNFENKTLTKNLDIKIDFGGILKGEIADRAFTFLKENGYEKGYISLGGSSLYILECENLSIRHPINMGQNIAKLDLKSYRNMPVSTSGDYERYYIDESTGKTYSHVINPITGYPTETGVKSATILGGNSALSDALTTAILLKEHNLDAQNSELIEFLKKLASDDLASIVFVVYSKDNVNQIITNAKKGEEFTLLDTNFEVVNI